MRLADVQVTRAVVATVWHFLYLAPIPICTSDDSPAWRRKAVVEDLTLNEPSSRHVTPNVELSGGPQARPLERRVRLMVKHGNLGQQ